LWIPYVKNRWTQQGILVSIGAHGERNKSFLRNYQYFNYKEATKFENGNYDKDKRPYVICQENNFVVRTLTRLKEMD